MTVAFGYENRLPTATLTAGAELASTPSSFLANDQGSDRWTTPGGVVTAAGGAYVDIDAGAAVDWRLFGAFRTNLSTAATVTITLGTSAGASDVYSSGALSGIVAGFNQRVHDAGADYSARYCRFAFDDSANADAQIAVGLIYAGPAFLPARQFNLGWPFGRAGSATRAATRGGAIHPSPRALARSGAFAFDFLTEAEAMVEILEIDAHARAAGNVLLIPKVGGTYEQRQAVFGLLTPDGLPAEIGFNRWRYAFTMTERL